MTQQAHPPRLDQGSGSDRASAVTATHQSAGVPIERAFALDRWVSHNSAIVSGDRPLQVTTPAERWAYALELPIDTLDASAAGSAVVSIEAEVAAGVVGVACLDRDGEIIAEKEWSPADGHGYVELPLASLASCRSIVFRNTSPASTASTVRVWGVLVRATDATRGTTDQPRPEIVLDRQTFAPYTPWSGFTPAGYWTDWLGVRTRVDVWDFTDEYLAVYNRDRQESLAYPLDDEHVLDWVPLLEAVNAAGETFTMIALGAGWGRWLTGGAFAARQTGRDFRLVGVEAEPQHFEWLQRHLRDNGIDPERTRLIRAAASSVDGDCWFPIGNSAAWYGQSIRADASIPDLDGRGVPVGTQIEHQGTTLLRMHSVDIETAIGDLPLVDYMHMDIQGSEYDFLTAKPELLQTRVRCVNIGTHTEEIERGLREYFTSLGWVCRYDVALDATVTVRLGLDAPRDVSFGDGVQVWVNPALGGQYPALPSTQTTPAGADRPLRPAAVTSPPEHPPAEDGGSAPLGPGRVGEPFAGLLRAAQADPVVAPVPGWHLGAGEDPGRPEVRDRLFLYRQLPAPIALPWLHGLRLHLYPDNETCRSIYVTGLFEPNELSWLETAVEPGQVFVDLGANLGVYTLLAARLVGPEGRVLAVEPSSRDFDRLSQNVSLNGLGAYVQCVRAAVADAPGEAELLIAPDANSGHNTLGAFSYAVEPLGTENVSVDTLDRLVEAARLPRVDVIKMDIEGAELKALRGSLQTIRRFHPTILLELADRTLKYQGSHSGQIWALLAELGYRLYSFSSVTGLLEPATQKPEYDSENLVAVYDETHRATVAAPYPVQIAPRDPQTEPMPVDGGAIQFDHAPAQAINRARLDHLASLGLPLDGKRVLDVGAGVGHLAQFFVQRGCEVVCIEGRPENVARLRQLYPSLEAHVVDVENDPIDQLGQFDVVFAYGLLYHLEEPMGVLRKLGAVCRDVLVLETMVCDHPLPIVRLDDETGSVNQALRGLGTRPSPSYLALALNRAGFPYVYGTRFVPDHEDYRFDWCGDLAWFRDGHPLRCVFVASHTQLPTDRLVSLLDG